MAEHDRVILVGTAADHDPAGAQGALLKAAALPARSRQHGDSPRRSGPSDKSRPRGDEGPNVSVLTDAIAGGNLVEECPVCLADLSKQPGE
jgi:hypothetical protein